MSKKEARLILIGSAPKWKDMKMEAVNFSNEVEFPCSFPLQQNGMDLGIQTISPSETSLSTAEFPPFPLCKVCTCEKGFRKWIRTLHTWPG
jgi:hypothetical protein